MIDSGSTETRHFGWPDGVRIGHVSQDKVTAFIPPHYPTEGTVLQGLAGEGVAVDEDGNIFVAEGPASRPFAVGGLTKYERALD